MAPHAIFVADACETVRTFHTKLNSLLWVGLDVAQVRHVVEHALHHSLERELQRWTPCMTRSQQCDARAHRQIHPRTSARLTCVQLHISRVVQVCSSVVQTDEASDAARQQFRQRSKEDRAHSHS